MATRANPAPKRRGHRNRPPADDHDGRNVGVHPGEGRRELPAADSRSGHPDDGARALELALTQLRVFGLLARARIVEVQGCRVELAPQVPEQPRVDPEQAIKERERLDEDLAYMSS